ASSTASILRTVGTRSLARPASSVSIPRIASLSGPRASIVTSPISYPTVGSCDITFVTVISFSGRAPWRLRPITLLCLHVLRRGLDADPAACVDGCPDDTCTTRRQLHARMRRSVVHPSLARAGVARGRGLTPAEFGG